MLHLHRDLLLQGYYCYIMKLRGECRDAMFSISKITLRLESCFNVEQRIYALSSSVDSADTSQKLHQVHEHLPVYKSGIQEFQDRLDQLLIEHAKFSETLDNDKSVQKMEMLLQKIVAVHHQYRKDRMIGKSNWRQHKESEVFVQRRLCAEIQRAADDCARVEQRSSGNADPTSGLPHFLSGLLADLEMSEKRQYKSLDQTIYALHTEKSLHLTGIAPKDKDQMVSRMHHLKDEMEILVRELQCNNNIIESLGAMNSPGPDARPSTL
ncbi:hypothetical protein WMY93_031458 [Mugilogobius chulae]|uniref:Uncharacterized protein n=1 Tax=Mugilogobius chulae TaxID=88201 RepID=A0AAW0MFZ9_9GOBI